MHTCKFHTNAIKNDFGIIAGSDEFRFNNSLKHGVTALPSSYDKKKLLYKMKDLNIHCLFKSPIYLFILNSLQPDMCLLHIEFDKSTTSV